MEDLSALAGFYEQTYSTSDPARGALYARWRALGARGKADHVVALCERGGVTPACTLDVGCGDGALLSELARRGFGGRLEGAEITEAAVALAGAREEIARVSLYDGGTLAVGDGSFDLGILSHVLEHVREPASLLGEVARACGAVVVEVPLERNLSASRASRRARAQRVGHLQRLGRSDVRAIVEEAGLRVAGELDDPLPLAVHRFFAATWRERRAAELRWALRGAIHRLSPALARRLFTVHYACLCVAP